MFVQVWNTCKKKKKEKKLGILTSVLKQCLQTEGCIKLSKRGIQRNTFIDVLSAFTQENHLYIDIILVLIRF